MIARIRREIAARLKGFAKEMLRFLYRNGMMKPWLGDEAAFLKEELARLAIENAALKVAIEEFLADRRIPPVGREGVRHEGGRGDGDGMEE